MAEQASRLAAAAAVGAAHGSRREPGSRGKAAAGLRGRGGEHGRLSAARQRPAEQQHAVAALAGAAVLLPGLASVPSWSLEYGGWARWVPGLAFGK